jgi:hypothetical protein
VGDGRNLIFRGLNLVGGVQLGSKGEVVFDRCLFSWEEAGRTVWTLGTSRLEFYGDRTADSWTAARATERAKDEVLSALFELERAHRKGISLKEYYARHRESTVLILGSYSSAGIQRLRTLERAVADLGYEPVLISDVPDQPAQTLEQKVVMVGSLSRFVLIDDAEKSGHLTELPLCKANGWITVVLRPDGHASSAMSAAASVLSNVICELSYEPNAIESVLPEAIQWAEAKHSEIGLRIRAAYPWSTPPE